MEVSNHESIKVLDIPMAFHGEERAIQTGKVWICNNLLDHGNVGNVPRTIGIRNNNRYLNKNTGLCAERESQATNIALLLHQNHCSVSDI